MLTAGRITVYAEISVASVVGCGFHDTTARPTPAIASTSTGAAGSATGLTGAVGDDPARAPFRSPFTVAVGPPGETVTGDVTMCVPVAGGAFHATAANPLPGAAAASERRSGTRPELLVIAIALIETAAATPTSNRYLFMSTLRLASRLDGPDRSRSMPRQRSHLFACPDGSDFKHVSRIVRGRGPRIGEGRPPATMDNRARSVVDRARASFDDTPGAGHTSATRLVSRATGVPRGIGRIPISSSGVSPNLVRPTAGPVVCSRTVECRMMDAVVTGSWRRR